MLVAAELFRGLASKNFEKGRDRDGKKNAMWIVSAPFYVSKYINNGRHLLGQKTLRSERSESSVENSVEAVPMRSSG